MDKKFVEYDEISEGDDEFTSPGAGFRGAVAGAEGEAEEIEDDYDEDGNYVMRDANVPAKAKIPSVVFNLLNNVVGAGVLGLPYAFAKSRLLLGMFFVVFVAVMSYIGESFLVRASEFSPGKSYGALFKQKFGVPGAIAVELCVVLFFFGTLTSYFIVISDILPEYLFMLPFVSKPGNHYLRVAVEFSITLLVAALVVLPLCYLRRIRSLQYTSVFAVLCILYIGLLVGIASLREGVQYGLDPDLELLPASFAGVFEAFEAIPIMSFAFSFHPNVFAVFTEMRNATMRRIFTVSGAVIVLCASLYLYVGFVGYLHFVSGTLPNIFLNYKRHILCCDDADGVLQALQIGIHAGQLALAMVIIFSYPLIHYPMKLSLDFVLITIFSGGRPGTPTQQRLRQYGIATFLVSTTFLLAFVVKMAGLNVESIFGIFGSTAGSFIMFFGPALMYFLLHPARWYSPRKLLAIATMLVSVIISIIALTVIISGIIVNERVESNDCKCRS